MVEVRCGTGELQRLESSDEAEARRRSSRRGSPSLLQPPPTAILTKMALWKWSSSHQKTMIRARISHLQGAAGAQMLGRSRRESVRRGLATGRLSERLEELPTVAYLSVRSLTTNP